MSLGSATVARFFIMAVLLAGLVITIPPIARAANPDFTIVPSRSQTAVPTPSVDNFISIHLYSLANFQGTITLTATSDSPGLDTRVKPSDLYIPPDGSNITYLFFNATLVGYYNVTLTASGSITHTLNIYVNATTPTIGDFDITPSPGKLIVPPGNTSNSTLTFTGEANFTGTIYLHANVFCNTCHPPITDGPSSPDVHLTPTTVWLDVNGTGKSTLSVQVPLLSRGEYTVQVVATSGFVYHALNIIVDTRPDFILTVDPAPLIIQAGESGRSTITLTSVNGFNDTVWLAVSLGTPSLQLFYDRRVVTLSPGGTETAVVTVMSTDSTPPGNYSIPVFAVKGLRSHMGTLNIIVTGRRQTSILGLSPMAFYAFTAFPAAALAVVAAVTINRRRKPLVKPTTDATSAR